VNLLLLCLGLVLVLAALMDALWTALWVDGGAGPITAQTTNGGWWVLSHLVPSKRHTWLSLAGPLIQTLTVMTWVGLLGVGWVLIFSADPTSLVYARTPEPEPSTPVDRIYFVAYTISTMGNGDLYPQRGGWSLVVAGASLSGMVLITMVISFLLSVISGVTTKQALAQQITGLGTSGSEFILHTWDGEGFGGLDLQLLSMSEGLGTLTEQQMAYPILHRYHGAAPQRDSAPAVVILDDALTILRYGIQETYRPPPALLQSARNTVQTYLKTLKSAAIYPADCLPPPPDLEPLRRAGLPVVSDAEFARSLDDLAQRRRLLLGLVQSNNFRWPG
jgi:hypothetical protein